jgi:hypothetical protein
MLKRMLVYLQVIVVLSFAVSSYAQETTALLNGRIADSKGAILSGAIILFEFYLLESKIAKVLF